MLASELVRRLPLRGAHARSLAPISPRRERAARLERELAGARTELAAVEAKGAEVAALEGRYWSEFNAYQLALAVR